MKLRVGYTFRFSYADFWRIVLYSEYPTVSYCNSRFYGKFTDSYFNCKLSYADFWRILLYSKYPTVRYCNKYIKLVHNLVTMFSYVLGSVS